MKHRPKQELLDFISQTTYQIEQLKKNIDKCETANNLYNRLLVERAIKRKFLYKKSQSNLFSKFKDKLCMKKSSEKLICDYF